MKSILFVTEKGKEIKKVDLCKLEGTARKLAEIVHTTENEDVKSKVELRSKKKYIELLEELGETKERIEMLRFVYGIETLEDKAIIEMSWDTLGVKETPEDYFIRHSKRVDNLGEIIDAINFGGKFNIYY